MNTLPPPRTAPTITEDELRALTATPIGPQPDELAALERLIAVARGNTGQSRRVADYLLAWWNAGSCGSFDLTTTWGVDTAIAQDMTTVFGLIARIAAYPDTLGYEADFKAIVRAWRPELED